ncbi:hypothetical protein ABZ349_29660 [Streptomyces niveus]|uniref:hypothetical protein n=1 Tax=Streptomyces niveus TaxID=193462 RepID=UPI0033F6E488
MTHLPSPEEVEAARTPNGGYGRTQLAAWGIDWPPPKGWSKEPKKRWQVQQNGDEHA